MNKDFIKNNFTVVLVIVLGLATVTIGSLSVLDLDGGDGMEEAVLIAGSEPYGESYSDTLVIGGMEVSTDIDGADLDDECSDNTMCRQTDLQESGELWIGDQTFTVERTGPDTFENNGVVVDLWIHNWRERERVGGTETLYYDSVRWAELEVQVDREYVAEQLDVQVSDINLYEEDGAEMISYSVDVRNNWIADVGGDLVIDVAGEEKVVQEGLELETLESKSFTVEDELDNYNQGALEIGTTSTYEVNYGFDDFKVLSSSLTGNADMNDDLAEDEYSFDDGDDWKLGSLQGSSEFEAFASSELTTAVYHIVDGECVLEEFEDQRLPDEFFDSRSECESVLEDRLAEDDDDDDGEKNGDEDSDNDGSAGGDDRSGSEESFTIMEWVLSIFPGGLF